MAGGRAFKSNVGERREAERRMKALEKRQKKEEKRRLAAEQAKPQPPPGTPRELASSAHPTPAPAPGRVDTPISRQYEAVRAAAYPSG